MKQKRTGFDKFNDLITKIGTIILMNLTFLVACIPVVTIGQAWCGLLSALRFQIRGDKWFDGFKFGFTNRFWRGTIAWLVTLLMAAVTMFDLINNIANGMDLVAIIASGLMFLLVAMIGISLIVLNVYIPTSVSDWLKNAVNMIFKGHIWLVLAAVAMWLPLVVAVFWGDIFYLTLMIYIAVYYALVALLITLVLKDALLDFLIEARENGTLTAEEGKHQLDDWEDEDEEEAE